ncbi:hypothetical protein SAMN02745126_06149 [Enhydrobacter aerosaccus]|uniref:Uncharacterized protein n=1 Tax=Enhydrobacter aerosaccus TaxID=225324 RepID=A0A1T4TG19_9HYPH|nr:hypothetical protein [Enhydrobacter aerosaccus]SKA39159.1 hypothetical protein SAMN02745126_06149 [Enhydrobacter aerosaccus]
MRTTIQALLSAGATAVLLVAAPAFAQGMPSGSYSSWSEAQKQQAATFLGEHCQQAAQCGGYIATAQAGTTRASYEAASCIAACFVSNLPTDYPDLEEIRQVALTNAEQAKKLGSSYQPRFEPAGKPDAAPK